MFSNFTFTFDVMPLRAIAFQALFLLMAIAIEMVVLHRYINIDHRTSAQYAITINLASTFIGWLLFFNVTPLLPPGLRAQLISYVFFDQFFQNVWLPGISPMVILLTLAIFLGTFWLKFQSLDWLERLLEKTPKEAEEKKPTKFRGRQQKPIGISEDNRAYAIFVGNALSFTAILFILFIRVVDQNYFSP